MSADSERLFSSCKITLEDLRNRIWPELLEALECLKSWNKIKEFDMLQLVAVVGSGSGEGEVASAEVASIEVASARCSQ